MYAQAIRILPSDLGLNFAGMTLYEQGIHTSAYFKDREMRFTAHKSSLRKSISVDLNQKGSGKATTFVFNLSAFLLTISWHSKGTLEDVIC